MPHPTARSETDPRPATPPAGIQELRDDRSPVGPAGVASAVDPGAAKPLATEEQPVADGTGAGNQTDPHLSGSLLAFTSIVDTSSEVRYTDLAAGSSGVIPNAGHRDSLPDVDG